MFLSYLRNLLSSPAKRGARAVLTRQRRRVRPQVEALEARWVPSYTIADLASFTGSNGNTPSGGLVQDSSGNLFGTTQVGGANGDGTVFEWVKSSGTISVLASFTGSNGANPYGGLIADSSGNFFGTTLLGGANGDGTVFEWVKSSGTISVLASFNDSNGANPYSGLIADTSGNLFGTTSNGGANGLGTVFEWVKSNGTISVLASFNDSNGANPYSGLFADTSGNLFGTTRLGGSSTYGTVFEWVKSSGTISVLASFNFGTGARPTAGLVEDTSGNLFGTTPLGGGSSNAGTVFEWVKSSGTISVLASFNSSNGANPTGTLIADSSGNLFSETVGGGANGDGTVFEWVKSSGTISVLASFNGSSGAYPAGNLIQDTSGNLFGTTKAGGAASAGTVFEAVPPPVVTGLSPNSGPHTGGTTVTISGTGLANATAVRFGSTAATIMSDTATQIVVKSPAEPLGTVDVTVTTAVGGTSATSSADRFTYTTTSTTWTGLSTADQNWSDPANWSNGVPGPGDTAVFTTTTGSTTAVVDAAFSVVLSIDSNWGGAIQVNQPLTTTGTSQWGSGTITVVVGVTWTNSGTLSLNAGGSLSVDGSGVLNDRGNLTVVANTTFTDSGEYLETGVLRVDNSATVMLTGAFDNYDGVGTLSGGIYDIVGTLQFANAVIVTDNARDLILDGPNAQVTDLNGTDALGPNLMTITVHGEMTVESGATFASPTDFSVAGALAVIAGNSSFTVGGNLSVAGKAYVYVANGGALSAAGDFTNQGNVELDPGGAVNVGGSYTQAAGRATLTIQSTGSLTTAGDFNDQGSVTIPNRATLSVGGILNVAGGATLTLQTGSTPRVTANMTNSGTVSIGALTLSVGGNYTEASGSTLTVANTGGITTTGDFNIQGNVTVPNGVTISVGGNLNVANGVTLTVPARGTLGVTGDVNNSGTLMLGAGETVSVGGNYTEASGSTLSIANTGGISTTGDFNVQANVTVANGVAISVGGNVNVASGATLTVQTGGTLSTTGDFNNLGSALIGMGVTVNVGGNYTQGASAALTVQLGGNPGSGLFGQLVVTGTANLAGTLTVQLVNGYSPLSGDAFTILTDGGLSGDFGTKTIPDSGVWSASSGSVTFP